MNHAAFSMRKYYAIGAAFLLIALFGLHSHFYRPSSMELLTQVDNPFVLPWAETPYLYLILHAFILLPIIALSFDRRVTFYKEWTYLFPAIFIVGIPFILWDFVFTALGVWGFSHDYTLSYRILEKLITWSLIGLLCLLGIWSWGRLYTSFTCLGTAILLTAHYLVYPNTYRTFFYKAQLVSFIPFILINGILTGSITSTPVVQYNPLEMLGKRFVTIPVEDFIYCFMLLLSVTTVYEYFKERQQP